MIITWNQFAIFAIIAVLLWVIGAWCAFKERKMGTILSTLGGIVVFFAFIVGMWVSLERPPLRTMGETRLWYSFFLPMAGLITWLRWRYKWILSFSTLLAVVFIGVNLFKPEIHSTTLMPALQSPWFAPHVIVYMFCYALFGAATMVASLMLIKRRDDLFPLLDNLVNVGLSFMTFGMLFGALWAKEAWGTYWSWDPKETWAAVTWLSYLVYVHLRLLPLSRRRARIMLVSLIVSFCCLQMCWWGINYLPSAQGKSVHTYNLG